jgi:putative transcriptional regulator
VFNLKNKIKELRNKRGVSQSALAEAVGVSKRTIYSIETENPDIHVSLAYKLAVYFNCSIEGLFNFFPDDIDELFEMLPGEIVPAELLHRT